MRQSCKLKSEHVGGGRDEAAMARPTRFVKTASVSSVGVIRPGATSVEVARL